jgi:hypothetical protein
MRMKPLLAAPLVLAALVAWWWDAGHGQAWLAVQTGTRCGATGVHYCYWSGFGSVMPWVLFSMGSLFAALVLAFRHVNCHVKGCPRVGRFPLAGGEFKVCGHHHPDWEGGHPPMRLMHERHRAWHRERAAAP